MDKTRVARREPWLLIAALALGPGSAGAVSLEDIVANNSRARGGYAAWKAVGSARLSGTLTSADGEAAPVVMEFKRPRLLRIQFELKGLTGIQVYDGRRGWQLMPFGGDSEPHPMSGAELTQLAASADFDGPLMDHQHNENRLQWIGSGQVQGADVFQLRLTGSGGEVTELYLDKVSYLEVKQTLRFAQPDGEVSVETLVGDYRNIGGLLIPHALEVRIAGVPGSQRLQIERVELNIEIPDERFLMPHVSDSR